MFHLRRLSKPFLIVALVAAALTASASPATAQGINVFVFQNDIDPAANEDENWQTRVTVTSLGGCTPEVGLGSEGYVSSWLRFGSQGGASLNTGTCAYRITAEARRNSREVCEAVVAWATSDPADRVFEDELNSGATARGTATQVFIRQKTRTVGGDEVPICASAVSVTFSIDPEEVVKELPDHSEDDDLAARAQRAVEVTDFDVRVRPHSSTKGDRGCDVLLAFTMQGGEDGEVEKALEGMPTGSDCRFTAFLINVPEPYVVDEDGKSFTADKTSLTVDLSGLLELRPARIAIVQDLVGTPAEDGGASYSIQRECAGVEALPPIARPSGGAGIYQLPGGGFRAALAEGRFTVHSNRNANFGPGATYQIAARSLTSNTVEGCTVSVTVGDLPEDCTVAGGETQTRTWRATRPFDHFDFEFDITCGGVPTPTTTEGPSDLPPTPEPSDDDDAAVSADPDVRIAARKLSNGKIEFALQQQQENDSWGDPLLPTRRFFPTSARVDHWLQSTPLTIMVAESAGDFSEDVQVRIIARRLSDGRVEFGLQQQDEGSWGSRLLPTRRYFPTDARVNRWLVSTALTLDTN